MSFTPTNNTGTAATSNRIVYSLEAAPDFKAQDQNLIALNTKAMEDCSETGFANPEGDGQWAKDGLEDSNVQLRRMDYGHREAGSEQAMDLAREYVQIFQQVGQG